MSESPWNEPSQRPEPVADDTREFRQAVTGMREAAPTSDRADPMAWWPGDDGAQHGARSPQHSPRSLQHSPRNLQHGARNLQHEGRTREKGRPGSS
ncbi:catechol 2,3-dioxygenase-like lactoylglutathione lyase family enzyme [Prauserella isguenensis]|uniref:Catechol 2,3-dioxygenase-like lactoylglutathione lyase family enzyme n=1 Tax=Prauserella isguenensis TaxID=1470180 RepID=A0A839RW19_9PSEU|nr:catechol 2,3-dioxygenase-like lactoylglutathione lyase family enzyme [Prauserella isguenensis]